MPGEPSTRSRPFTKPSQTDCTSASTCAGRLCSLVWLKSARRTGRLATAWPNTRPMFREAETLLQVEFEYQSYCRPYGDAIVDRHRMGHRVGADHIHHTYSIA